MKNEPGEWGRGNNGRKETVGGERTAWTAPASVRTSPKLKGIKQFSALKAQRAVRLSVFTLLKTGF